MRFNEHLRLVGNHALLSPSNPSWVNYDEEKLGAVVTASFAARRGSELHSLAQQLITLGVKLPDTNQTLNRYVNDCIGFRMKPEQILVYSPNCFGTTDAISYRQKLLRIFDLKNGVTPAKFPQLRIYAALFCLEYDVEPTTIEIDLRIYQNDDVMVEEGDPLVIKQIMEHITFADRYIERLKEEVYG